MEEEIAYRSPIGREKIKRTFYIAWCRKFSNIYIVAYASTYPSRL